jgi:hypothetical protein
MNRLTKRVEAMERGQEDVQKRKILMVSYPSDGGLEYDGVWYADTASLFNTLRYAPDTLVLGIHLEQTAAELITEAEERKRNPPPVVTIDELGEYGRSLVEGGCSPAIAKYIESLNNEQGDR